MAETVPNVNIGRHDNPARTFPDIPRMSQCVPVPVKLRWRIRMAGKILQTSRRDWLSIAAADNLLSRDDIVLIARTFADHLTA